MSRSFGWRALPEPRDPLPEGSVDLYVAGCLGGFLDPVGQYAEDHAGSLDGEVLEGTLTLAFLSGMVAGHGMDNAEAEDVRRLLTALAEHGRVEIEVRP